MATYYSGIHGISFRVDCSNYIEGTYPNIKHKVSYTIYLQHAYSANSTQYNGAILNFGYNSHSVNINVGGAGTWALASGTLEYSFATNNRTDSRNIYFSTSFGTGFANISASGSQTETATISIPEIKDVELSSTYNSISYEVTLDSNPYDFYTIKATLDKDSKIGTEGKFEGLTPNKEYEVNCYVRYRGDTSVLLVNPVSKFIKTKKPNKPKAGKVEASNITYKSAYISWSGFEIKEGANSYYYQYSYDGIIWKDLQTQTKLVVDDLVPETIYTFYIRIVDDFGTPSDYANVGFTTPADQAKIAYHVIDYQEGILTKDGFEITDKKGNVLLAEMISDTGKLSQAKVWYNDNGVIKKVKKIYFNNGNDIKANINYGG